MKIGKGSVLIYTLWILAVVSLILSLVLYDLKLLNLQAGKQVERYKFLIESHAAAKVALLEALKFPSLVGRVKVNLNRNYIVDLGGRKYIVKLSAEDGRYPVTINYASTAELIRLFRALKLKSPEELADVILDFQDKDNLMRLRGAEDNYYRKFGYIPPNRKLISLEELMWIKGIDFQTYEKLKDYVTVYSDRVNLNYAPEEVLLALGFSPQQAKRIVEERENRPVSVQDIKMMLGGRWNLLRLRISLIPLPQLYRAEVISKLTGDRVELILKPNGRLVDVLWY